MIYIAIFEGRKSTFEAVGSSEVNALVILQNYIGALDEWVYRREGLEYFDADVYVRQVSIGKVYIDGEVWQ